jgi:hypothetical protein
MQTLARYLMLDLDTIKQMSESELICQCRCRLQYLARELSQLEEDGSSPVDHLDLRNTFRKNYNFFQERGLVDGGWGQFFPKKQEQS